MSQPYAPAETPLFKALWEAQEGRCALCGQSMPSNRFDLAHSTHARCNKVKGMGNVRRPAPKA
jgi:hypothetical protein